MGNVATRHQPSLGLPHGGPQLARRWYARQRATVAGPVAVSPVASGPGGGA